MNLVAHNLDKFSRIHWHADETGLAVFEDRYVTDTACRFFNTKRMRTWKTWIRKSIFA